MRPIRDDSGDRDGWWIGERFVPEDGSDLTRRDAEIAALLARVDHLNLCQEHLNEENSRFLEDVIIGCANELVRLDHEVRDQRQDELNEALAALAWVTKGLPLGAENLPEMLRPPEFVARQVRLAMAANPPGGLR